VSYFPNNDDLKTAGAWTALVLAMATIIALASPAPAQVLPIPGPYQVSEPAPTDPLDAELVIVHDNNGGIVADFLKLRDEWTLAGAEVQISGYCASACTLFLGVPDVCVEPGTRLMFHAPFFWPMEGVKVYNTFMTLAFMTEYPPAIQQWIVSKGGLGPDWIVLEGSELLDLVPLCD
jgi:hypothetical protein